MKDLMKPEMNGFVYGWTQPALTELEGSALRCEASIKTAELL